MTQILNRQRPAINHDHPSRDILVGETGPDWEPGPSSRFFAQRGQGRFAFGETESEAFMALLEAERKAGE